MQQQNRRISALGLAIPGILAASNAAAEPSPGKYFNAKVRNWTVQGKLP